jgi:hypothetical protein
MKIEFLVFFFLLATLFLSLSNSRSQAQNSQHNQAWFDASLKIKPTPKLTVTPEVGYRSEPAIKLNQVYLRTYLTYQVHKNVKLSVWAAHFNSWKPAKQRAIEVRTSQFVSLFWPNVAGFRFEHRLGLDQRLFYFSGYALNKYVHRSRVRLGLHTPNFALLGTSKNFYANASFEVLRNINQSETTQWVDHDWITMVVGFRMNKNLKIEANILMINLFDPIELEFEREITVFRLRLKGNF